MAPRKVAPAAVEDRPECWAIDGCYLGATPIGRPCIAPLVAIDESRRWVIGYHVLQDSPPPRWLVTDLCSMPSRAWWEWHWYRGINPEARRPAIPDWMRKAVIDRDGYVCGLCQNEVDPSDVHLDHIRPFSLGGPTLIGNLQVTHSACNIRKGNRL